LREDPTIPELFGMESVVGDDTVRRFFNPSSAVGAGSENSFRGERFFQRGGLRGKLIFWSDVVPNTPL
jgi:hypothetical protein